MALFVTFLIYAVTLKLTNYFQRLADSEDDFRLGCLKVSQQ